MVCSFLVPGKCDDAAVEKAIAAAKYGCVCVNSWGVFGYMGMLRGGTWGAHPDDRRSGKGVIGNPFQLAATKLVLRGLPLKNPPIVDPDTSPPAVVMDLLHVATLRGALPALGTMALRVLQKAAVSLRLRDPAKRRAGAVY